MLTELQAAEAIRDGLLDSPQQFGSMWLYALRITGTGLAYRAGLREYVWRDASLYLNDEFLARCNGLPVIFEHPDKKAAIDSDEFADRVVGAIMLPYVKDDEVWGIARIYDAPTITLMQNKQLSTSPGVVFSNSNNNLSKSLDDGTKLLVEGEANLLDHLAICALGVWDKGGDPAGVDNGGSQVATENEMKEAEEAARKDAEAKKAEDCARADAEKERWAKFDAFMDSVNKRLDAFEVSKVEAKKESDEAEAKKKAEEAESAERKDGEEQARKDADMKARMDALEAAVKPRADSEAAELAEEQSRADSVFGAWGQRAKPPMLGEGLVSYRARLAGELKQHSKAWKGIDLLKLGADALTIARDQIYHDAQEAARNPTVNSGQLVEIRQKINGADVVTFKGDWDTAFSQFRVRPRKYAGRVQQGAA